MVTKRKLTVEDIFAMGETGLIAPDERVELIDGELYTMTPPSSQHAGTVKRLAKRFERSFGDRTIVSVQDPLILGEHHLVEPDLALLKPDETFYTDRHPNADDALLVVEVSVSSLQFDREQKLPTYAGAGIPEVWIVNVADQKLEVYREPQGDLYRHRLLLNLDEAVTPVAIPSAAAVTLL